MWWYIVGTGVNSQLLIAYSAAKHIFIKVSMKEDVDPVEIW